MDADDELSNTDVFSRLVSELKRESLDVLFFDALPILAPTWWLRQRGWCPKRNMMICVKYSFILLARRLPMVFVAGASMVFAIH